MTRPWRPRLWHLSALVLASALAMALAREASTIRQMALFGPVFALVGMACYLGSVYIGARLAGVASEALIERGRAMDGPTGRFLVVLGFLAYCPRSWDLKTLAFRRSLQ